MDRKYYVYAYLDPMKEGKYSYGIYNFDYMPFYIGKGKNGRDKVHLENALNSQMKERIQEIKKTLNTNPVIVRVWNELTEDEALDLEPSMIATIGRKNINTGPLLNLTPGGEGITHGKTFILEHPYVPEPQIFNSPRAVRRFFRSINVDYNKPQDTGWTINTI